MSSVSRPEIFVFSCWDDDVGVLRRTSGSFHLHLRLIPTPLELTRQAAIHAPVAVILGIGRRTRSHLDLIPVLRALRKNLPVIVVAEEDSLDLERSARERGIFYYLVRPLESSEVEAVLSDVERHTGA